jgi:hypothetical protein
MPKVLFSSVFKPFAEADNLYSRVDSKIELWHNQVTKYQGVFSPRAHYPSFGLHAIANNLGTPSTVLDFPSLPRFIEEVKKGYDYIGIGSIGANFNKVKCMTEEIRRWSPKTKIIIGGFCAMIENLEKMLEVDYICRGEGISFMRELLGLPPEFKFRQPDTYSWPREILGVPIFWGKKDPMLIVGLGCPYGCDFCSPSHFFGKKHIKFLKTGQDVFDEIVRLGKLCKADMFSLMGDDNFLADKKRARELHDLVLASNLQFNLFLFASANLVAEWEPEELAEMGVNDNIDIKGLLANLRTVGIKVILSSILLLDCHTKENIWEDVEGHLACKPTLSQFAFYSPAPGTPLYERLKEEGRLLTSIPFEEWHAFKQPVFAHPHFSLLEGEKIQEKAYLEDFHRLGPSMVRTIDTEVEGYLNLKDSKRPFLRDRAEFLARNFSAYRVVLKASEHLVPRPEMKKYVQEVQSRLESASRGITLLERTEALGLTGFGKVRQWRTAHWGDAIQPKTRLVHYEG